MTQQGFSPPRVGDTDPSTAQVAKDRAAGVGQTAADRGGDVAGTAADQAKQVAAEARRQAGDLLDQGIGELREQARVGQAKAAEQLHALADQLQGMSDKAEEPGVAPDVVHEVAQRARKAASWLDSREPGDLVEDVRSFARRRPGAFLFGAAAAGLLLGRLTRGATAARHDDSPARPEAQAPAPSRQDTDGFVAQPPPALPDGYQAQRPGIAQPDAHPTPGYPVPGSPVSGAQQPGTGF